MTTYDDSPTTRRLRDLDAADRELSPAQRGRAAVTLEQVLATDPGAAAPTASPARPPRRRLLLVAGGVVAAVTAAIVVVPTFTGGPAAFASWSPVPVALVGAERAAALEACVVLQSGESGQLALDPDAAASALLAEARGGWSYVLFTAAGPSGRELQGSCLVPDDLVADPRPDVGGFFGSLGPTDDEALPAPAPRVAREDTSGAGSVAGEAFVYAEGRAGAEVVGIEVTTPGGLEVEASLEGGRWAVWWPAGDDSMSNPDLTQAPTYLVRLRDGSEADTVR